MQVFRPMAMPMVYGSRAARLHVCRLHPGPSRSKFEKSLSLILSGRCSQHLLVFESSSCSPRDVRLISSLASGFFRLSATVPASKTFRTIQKRWALQAQTRHGEQTEIRAKKVNGREQRKNQYENEKKNQIKIKTQHRETRHALLVRGTVSGHNRAARLC